SVVGTDGKQLFVQSGFTLPWDDNVLVPRVPAFGCRELANSGPVSVGRTKTHVAIRAGPWAVLLSIDSTGRYPNAEDVIPRPRANATRLQVSPDDAARLIDVLPELPGREEENSPVTLSLDQPPIVTAREEQHGAVQKVVLTGSTISGPSRQLVMDRRYLRRALQLGFREIQVHGDQPVACRDERRIYLWMPLTGQQAVPPATTALSAPDSQPEPLR